MNIIPPGADYMSAINPTGDQVLDMITRICNPKTGLAKVHVNTTHAGKHVTVWSEQ